MERSLPGGKMLRHQSRVDRNGKGRLPPKAMGEVGRTNLHPWPSPCFSVTSSVEAADLPLVPIVYRQTALSTGKLHKICAA